MKGEIVTVLKPILLILNTIVMRAKHDVPLSPTLIYTTGASKNAEALFQDVLGRKDDADRTRNALNVLQRFRFLFSLPQSIERNIQQVKMT